MWILALLLSVLRVSPEKDEVTGPLTPDFQRFLERDEGRFGFALKGIEKYGPSGSYGGKKEEGEKPTHTPIVFIHGNADSALDMGESLYTTGWSKQIQHFQQKGYRASELFAISYGDRNITSSFNTKISCEIVGGHRQFVEAVLEYTKKKKVIIFGHSMGVTIARMIIQGGEIELDGEVCNLGPSLRPKVNTLLAIASANYGMCLCASLPVPSCSPEYGYYPGVCSGEEGDIASSCATAESTCEKFETPMSKMLDALNKDNMKDADHVFSLWSTGDNVLGMGNNSVWGRQTSIVPFSDKVFKFNLLDHFQLKTDTVKQQYHIVRHRKRHFLL